MEVCFDSLQLSVSPTSKSSALQNTPADHEVFRPHETSESNHWNRNFLKPVSSKDQFKTMATLVNYTCKSFIKLAPDKFKGPVHKNPGKEKCPDVKKNVDVAKLWL